MITVREADERDYPTICKLIENDLGYTGLVESEVIRRLEYFRESDNWATFVAVIQDEVVGFIGVTKGLAYNVDGYYFQIMALAVSDKVHNRGVGTALVGKAEEWSAMQGANDISVSSSIKRLNAHIFYEHRGYTKTKESFLFIKPLKSY